MHSLRNLIFRQRRICALLVALTLAMKALLPAGFMISGGPRQLTVLVCTDATAPGSVAHLAITVGRTADSGKQERGKSSEACPYAALSMASLGGADAALLAVALAFVLALGFAPHAIWPISNIPYLRPPLRGPPLTA